METEENTARAKAFGGGPATDNRPPYRAGWHSPSHGLIRKGELASVLLAAHVGGRRELVANTNTGWSFRFEGHEWDEAMDWCETVLKAGGPSLKGVPHYAATDPLPHNADPREIATRRVNDAAAPRPLDKLNAELDKPLPPLRMGPRDDVATVAVKHDADKHGFEYLPPDALSAINDVLRFGAQKYAPHNWEKGFAWLRLANAMIRHIMAWITGEDKDPETGLSHLAHAGCMLLFALAHEIRGLGTDDRPKR